MGKGRFVNQKLGKRAGRRNSLLKSRLSSTRPVGRPSDAGGTRVTRKTFSDGAPNRTR